MSRTGSCLCGACRFTADPMPSLQACHCGMCRTWSGGPFMAVPSRNAVFEGPVSSYASSGHGERGFCATCRSTLFFDPPHLDWIAVSMGAFDKPTDTRLAIHIFVADKGDYYDIADGLPQHDGHDHDVRMPDG